MVLVTVDRSFRTASVCDKYEVVFCQGNAFLNTLDLALDRRCHFLAIVNIKEYICDLGIELEVHTCILQIFLHRQDQGLILVVFCKFQGTEIR